ncbi:hypothetical protein LWI28_015648 [Acer negundo]|uniref:Uncharacterized protein n=1 Tax=Acer negundo TaxID=4023 RepID=A0AAD5JLT4_ACENE|nr:hypothetical protein LWI28_015648 [Acer negundo]
MFFKSQTVEDNKAIKPTKNKQNQRFPPKRGRVMINILKGIFGRKRRENGLGGLSSSSTTPAATPNLYNSDDEFESQLSFDTSSNSAIQLSKPLNPAEDDGDGDMKRRQQRQRQMCSDDGDGEVRPAATTVMTTATRRATDELEGVVVLRAKEDSGNPLVCVAVVTVAVITAHPASPSPLPLSIHAAANLGSHHHRFPLSWVV